MFQVQFERSRRKNSLKYQLKREKHNLWKTVILRNPVIPPKRWHHLDHYHHHCHLLDYHHRHHLNHHHHRSKSKKKCKRLTSVVKRDELVVVLIHNIQEFVRFNKRFKLEDRKHHITTFLKNLLIETNAAANEIAENANVVTIERADNANAATTETANNANAAETETADNKSKPNTLPSPSSSASSDTSSVPSFLIPSTPSWTKRYKQPKKCLSPCCYDYNKLSSPDSKPLRLADGRIPSTCEDFADLIENVLYERLEYKDRMSWAVCLLGLICSVGIQFRYEILAKWGFCVVKNSCRV